MPDSLRRVSRGQFFRDSVSERLSPAYGNPGAVAGSTQLLSNLVTVREGLRPGIVNHYNVQPVFDIYANVHRRDLGGVARDVQKIVREQTPHAARGTSPRAAGPGRYNANVVLPPRPRNGLRRGPGLSAHGGELPVLARSVYHSDCAARRDGRHPLDAVSSPQTTLSVPSLMGAIMTIGVATANSILMVTFANDERDDGLSAPERSVDAAGHARIRPVLMTATAMILGMLPMALGHGRRRRTERAAGPRRDRRADVRHRDDAVHRAR